MLENTLMRLEQVHRLREDFMRARIKVTNQVKASKRRISKHPVDEDLSPDIHYESLLSTKVFDAPEKAYAKQLEALAKGLPAYTWFCAQDGCSTLSFAMILAETGDLSKYPNPAKVWKRMGLAVGQDGESDKNRTKGVNSGYSKRRRMIAYRVGSAVVKVGKKYRQVYLDRKAYEDERDRSGYNEEYVKRNRSFMSGAYSSKENQERIKSGRLPLCVIDLRAQRYMTKRLLRDLWVQWKEEASCVPFGA